MFDTGERGSDRHSNGPEVTVIEQQGQECHEDQMDPSPWSLHWHLRRGREVTGGLQKEAANVQAIDPRGTSQEERQGKANLK